MKKSFDTEILCVGTEILLGHITNTDARDISEMLSKIGINVKYHTVVGDNPERLRRCVEIAKNRADILITTGGLGPTCDDLTKQILADAFGKKLVKSEREAQGLYEYIRTGRGLTPNTYSQALVPEGCEIFHNLWGTAPGCAFEAEGKHVLMFPGPPKECVPMFRHYALPYLKKLSDEVIVSHSLQIFGIGESEDIECLEQAVMALLQEKKLTFATAESCTGGDIARRFTELPGASAFFKGGVVSYTNEVKTALLGVDAQLLEEKTAVCREAAAAMAEGVRARLGTDLAVSVTGLAGPDGDGVHEVGTVFIGLAASDGTWVRETHMGTFRTRSFIRRMAGNHAFDMMRRWMCGLKVD